MSPQIKEALREAGAVLVRHKKHDVYRLANGRNIVLSHSPGPKSSWKREQNILRNIRVAASL